MDNTEYEDVLELYELKKRDKNGKVFENLYLFHKNAIFGTIFFHKSLYKAIWVSLDYTTGNQIDNS